MAAAAARSFSADRTLARLWLPQPESFPRYAVDQQSGVAGSTLEFYRQALALRTALGPGQGSHAWAASLKPTLGVVAYTKDPVTVVLNAGDAPWRLEHDARVVLAGGPDAVSNAQLSPDSAVWLMS